MCERVIGVSILVEDMRVGDFFLQAAGDTDVGFGGVEGGLGGSADDGCVEGAQDGDFLGGHLFGEGDDGFVACHRQHISPRPRTRRAVSTFDGCDQSQPNPTTSISSKPRQHYPQL